MKRTMATLGAVGLAALAVAAPAIADANNTTFCHAAGKGYLTVTIHQPGYAGHDAHADDIIPPGPGLPNGLNWSTGKDIFANGCQAPAPVDPPVVVDPPVTPPATPPAEEQPAVVDPPAVSPPAETPVVESAPVRSPAAVEPAAAPAQQAAAQVPAAQQAPAVQKAPAGQQAAAAPAAKAVVGTNEGYNAQTAVGGQDAPPAWLAGVGALAAAGAAVAVRRRSPSPHTAG